MRLTIGFVILASLGVSGCKPAGSASSSNTTDDVVIEEFEELEIEVPHSLPADPPSPASPSSPSSDSSMELSPASGPAANALAAAATDGVPDPQPDQVAKASAKVLLGSPELTAGIPGQGPLTVEEIKAWLDKPENHVALDIELPVGLAAGASLIRGIQENPMTRAKIELGRQLYFDGRLSSDGTVSCASCHAPEEGFAKHDRFGVGVDGQTGNRNSPVSYNRILSANQFWDGRAATLEAQAVGPIENPIEMASTHDECVATLAAIPGYKLQFEAIFPDDGVTIDNVGKAIATFERTIVSAPAPYDYYEVVRSVETQFEEDELEDLKEDDPELFARYSEAVEKSAPMSESARRGRELFFSDKANCTECHAGANFTDEEYHNLGVGMEADEPDLGRFAETKAEKDKGAFKTPTVRNVSLSAPYMHDGSQESLEEVVAWYVKGGHPNDWLSDKIKKLDLTEQDEKDLVAFMKEGLTSDFPAIESGRLPK